MKPEINMLKRLKQGHDIVKYKVRNVSHFYTWGMALLTKTSPSCEECAKDFRL